MYDSNNKVILVLGSYMKINNNLTDVKFVIKTIAYII